MFFKSYYEKNEINKLEYHIRYSYNIIIASDIGF